MALVILGHTVLFRNFFMLVCVLMWAVQPGRVDPAAQEAPMCSARVCCLRVVGVCACVCPGVPQNPTDFYSHAARAWTFQIIPSEFPLTCSGRTSGEICPLRRQVCGCSHAPYPVFGPRQAQSLVWTVSS
jgi:hypothetical protein